MTITVVDRSNLRVVSARVAQALKTLEQELGVTFASKGGVYSNGRTGEIRFEFAVQAKDGATESPGAIRFKQYATVFGLQPDDLGRSFLYKNQFWKITGLNPNAHRYPIEAEAGGKTMRFPIDTVRRTIQRRALAA